MDDYLTKPIKQDELAATIARWLSHTKDDSDKLASKPSTKMTAKTYVAGIAERLNELREQLGNEVVSELIDALFADTERCMTNLRLAVEQVDTNGLRREAHRMKGSFSNLGARFLAETCEHLEQRGETGAVQGADSFLTQLEDGWNAVQTVFEKERLQAA